MTNTMLANLTDDQLIAEAKRLASDERRATAGVVCVLMEFDTRKLFLREGCSSLFTYCTQVLCLAEGAAYNRSQPSARRLCRRRALRSRIGRRTTHKSWRPLRCRRSVACRRGLRPS